MGLGTLLGACRTPVSQSVPTPLPPCPAPVMDVSAWELIDRRTFAFRLPPGFRQVPVQGIDSYVEHFEADGGNSSVGFDFGWYSNDLQFDPGMYSRYERCTELIGGRTAAVITAVMINPDSRRQHGRQVAAATWRNLHDAPDTVAGKDHLTIWAETRDPRRLPQLLAMLRTVEFHRR